MKIEDFKVGKFFSLRLSFSPKTLQERLSNKLKHLRSLQMTEWLCAWLKKIRRLFLAVNLGLYSL